MSLDLELEALNACYGAREWAHGKTVEEAWATCEHADWMFWYAFRRHVKGPFLAKAVNACLESVKPNDNEFSRNGLDYAILLAADVSEFPENAETAVFSALRACWGRDVHPTYVHLQADDDSAYSSDREAMSKRFCDIIRQHIKVEMLMAPNLAAQAEMEELLR